MTDILFSFSGPGVCAGHCRARVFEFAGAPVVIVTELADNPGASVTNALEAICAQLCDELELDARDAVFIEHYGAAPADDLTERFAAVNFAHIERGRGLWRLRTPRWAPMARAEVEALTGARWTPEIE